MGWGHMPNFLIADELRDGRLLSIAGRHLRGGATGRMARSPAGYGTISRNRRRP